MAELVSLVSRVAPSCDEFRRGRMHWFPFSSQSAVSMHDAYTGSKHEDSDRGKSFVGDDVHTCVRLGWSPSKACAYKAREKSASWLPYLPKEGK